ncbi:hypothetical protein QUF80_00770 [Desulfococcaceae bacterium HSG8]|nr:hypothetical protein [Desulfococcaceae bacterium HSG8]
MIQFILKENKDQEELLKSAETCVDKLPVRLFSSYHHTKVVIYSWLAWQKRLGQTLDITVNGDLIDFNSKEIQGFIQWLYNVFGIKEISKK